MIRRAVRGVGHIVPCGRARQPAVLAGCGGLGGLVGVVHWVGYVCMYTENSGRLAARDILAGGSLRG
jgi:hypothetical protein